LSTTLSKIWLSIGPFFRSFSHNSLVSRPFSGHKVSNRSSHHVLQNGPGAVSSIQLSFWSTVRSNLGQTWSTLVKLGRIWSKPSKLWDMYPGIHFEGFWARWTPVGLGTARSNLGQTSVNSSQTWSTLANLVKPWEMCPGPSSWEYLTRRGSVGSCWLGPGCPVFRADTRENPVGKNGVMTPVTRSAKPPV
jgi:hypothetical protein